MPCRSLSSTLALMNLPYWYKPTGGCLIDHCHQHWPHNDDQSVGWCKSTLPSLSELGVNVCRYQLSASACILYCYLHSWDCEMYFVMCVADSNCPYCEAPSIKWGGELEGLSPPAHDFVGLHFICLPKLSVWLAHFIGFLSRRGFYQHAGYFGHKPLLAPRSDSATL